MTLLPLRLHARIVLVVSCILLATGIASGWITARNQTASLMTAMRADSAVIARNFAESYARFLLLQDYAELESQLLKAADLPDIQRLQISEPDGALVGEVERGPDGRPQTKTGIAHIVPPPSPSARLDVRNEMLVVWQPIVAGNMLGWLRAEFSLAAIRQAQARAWEDALIMALAWMALSAGLIILLLRPSVRAIGQLTDFAKQLDQHKGAQISISHQPLEIADLGKSLNEASAKLLSGEQQLLDEQVRLRESEKGFKEAQRLAQIGSWDWDIATDTITWSEEYYRIYGFDPTQRPPGYEEHLKAYTPESAARLDAAVKQNTQTGEPYELDLELARTEGPRRWITARSETKRDAHGQITGLRGTAQEISERKQAEAMRAQLAAIVESSSDAILGMDLNAVITSWNPGAEKIYGYRADEAIGQPAAILAPEGKKDETRDLIQSVERGEAVIALETERIRRDGRRIAVAFSLSPIKDTGGRTVGVSAIARDITEKKQAERALRKVNRALKATSDCNMALIHAGDEMQLLQDICRIVVDTGGYRLAWVGYIEHDANHTVRPVAHSGYEPGYMEHAEMSWADNERGSGPLGIAMRKREIQVVQDVNSDPHFEPWRANAARLGYGSVLVAPLLSGSQLIGALSIHAEGINAFDAGEIALLGELAADMAFGIVTLRTRNAHQQSAARLQHSMEATIQVISNTLELRDPHSAGHQRRVTELSAAIARHMGLSEDRVRGVHLAGAVHDLGRIQVPADILSKPGKLSRIEFELVKTHSEAGYEILKGVDFPWPIALIVVQHHERLDGSGYPRGLKSGELLLESRIIAVADVVEAMVSHRPYRPALSVKAALAEISAGAGTFYDPDVVRACIALFRDKGFAFKD